MLMCSATPNIYKFKHLHMKKKYINTNVTHNTILTLKNIPNHKHIDNWDMRTGDSFSVAMGVYIYNATNGHKYL